MENTVFQLDSSQFNELIAGINELSTQIQDLSTALHEYAIFFAVVSAIIIFFLIIGVVGRVFHN